MTSWQIVRVVAGSFILISLALGVPGSPVFMSQWWLAFTAFVGVNLLQSGLTRRPRGERVGLDRHAFLLGVHHFDEVVRAGQAARMRGQKAVTATVHAGSPGHMSLPKCKGRK